MALVAIGSIAAHAAPAQAAFPGENGKIAFVRGGDIWTMNADGTNPMQLTSGPADDAWPNWSPDGARIAFDSNRAAGGARQIYVMNADGSNVQPVGVTPAVQPAWSPDGTKLAFRHPCCSNPNPWIMNADGSGAQGVGNAPFTTVGGAQFPSWSPDGTEIAAIADDCSDHCVGWGLFKIPAAGGSSQSLIFADYGALDWSPDNGFIAFTLDAGGIGDLEGITRINRSGGGFTDLSEVGLNPAWSPDGSKIAFDTVGEIQVMNAGGTGAVSLGLGHAPDWQPILKGYARPKGAGTLHAPLVLAYEPCTSPNRQHAAPLSFASCNPPTQTSTQLTLGTPDANVKPAGSVASLRIGVIPGLAGPPDDAEANLITSITDVRNAGDLSDYTGNLEMRVPLRITDKSNTPYPGGPGPGTAVDFTFTWNVPCTATSDPNTGSSCYLFTTADTLLPGSALEGRRAIWQTEQIEVRDGVGQAFLRQGVFVP